MHVISADFSVWLSTILQEAAKSLQEENSEGNTYNDSSNVFETLNCFIYFQQRARLKNRHI